MSTTQTPAQGHADHPGEFDQFLFEQRNRVKVWRSAKGEPQWQIEIIEGADENEIARLTQLAVAQYEWLQSVLT